MAAKKEMLSLKDIARLLKISAATVNYYTNIGLFLITERKGNSRLYDKKDTLARFARIKKLRKQGYSLGLIKQRMAG